MTDQPDSMLVHCGSCKHEWFALKLPMLMREAAEKLMSLECPHCTRRSKIYCGPAPVGEKTTDDLVTRLRVRAEFTGPYSALWDEAADRIEQLEAALRMVIDWDNTLDWEDGPAWGDLMDIARKALEGKDD